MRPRKKESEKRDATKTITLRLDQHRSWIYDFLKNVTYIETVAGKKGIENEVTLETTALKFLVAGITQTEIKDFTRKVKLLEEKLKEELQEKLDATNNS